MPAEWPERALGSPGGPQPGRVGAQARGMLGSVKMEAHDLAEWSYYPEAGEVCPRGWRSGKRGAGVELRAGMQTGAAVVWAQVGAKGLGTQTPGVGVSRAQGDETWESDSDQHGPGMLCFQARKMLARKP